MSDQRTFSKRSAGFSMVELVVLMVIIGILAGIAAPNFLSYIPKSRLNGAAMEIMVDLMSARMTAVKLNRSAQVNFISNTQYIIDPAGDAIVKNIQDNYSDVTFVATANPVFTSRGTASPAAGITVSNVSGSKKITISIAGRVKIN